MDDPGTIDTTRIHFYLHAAVAAYCLACGGLDFVGLFRQWMVPDVDTFYCLLFSAAVFPIIGLVAVIKHRPKNGLISLSMQGVFSGVQLIGLITLVG